MGQQDVNLGAQIVITGASGIEKLSLSRSIEIERFRKQVLHLLPAFRGDEWPPMF